MLIKWSRPGSGCDGSGPSSWPPQPPVDQEDLVAAEHHVRGLDVAVYHLTLVGPGQGPADLQEDPQVILGERVAWIPFPAVDELLGQVGRGVGVGAEQVDRWYALVIEHGLDPPLVKQPPRPGSVPHALQRHGLGGSFAGRPPRRSSDRPPSPGARRGTRPGGGSWHRIQRPGLRPAGRGCGLGFGLRVEGGWFLPPGGVDDLGPDAEGPSRGGAIGCEQPANPARRPRTASGNSRAGRPCYAWCASRWRPAPRRPPSMP